MKKFKINGSEFYEHFAQYDTWLEVLDHLIEHEHIRRKTKRGKEFFRDVANDIVNGLVISKRRAASLLEDMSRALIQPPKSYDGDAIIPMPADLELLSKLSKSQKSKWKKRIGNKTRAPRQQGLSVSSAGARRIVGAQSADTRQAFGTEMGIEIIDENTNSTDLNLTELNLTKLNPTANDTAIANSAPRGTASSTQELAASPQESDVHSQQLSDVANGSSRELFVPGESQLGMKLNPAAIASSGNIHYLSANSKQVSGLEVNDPARIGEPNTISLDDGFIARVKNKTNGISDGEYKITLTTKSDAAVYTTYLSGTDDRPFGPHRTRSPHLHTFAKTVADLIAGGFGAQCQLNGQFQFGQFLRWGENANSQVSLADHYAVLWMHPNQTTMTLFMVLGNQCHVSQSELVGSYGSLKNLNLLAAVGSRIPVMPEPYREGMFNEFIEGVIATQEKLQIRG